MLATRSRAAIWRGWRLVFVLVQLSRHADACSLLTLSRELGLDQTSTYSLLSELHVLRLVEKVTLPTGKGVPRKMVHWMAEAA